jgi:hypothetical protein
MSDELRTYQPIPADTIIYLRADDDENRYGRWYDEPVGEDCEAWALLGLLTYSDYSGCSVHRSNFRVFIEDIDPEELETGGTFRVFYGGYGTEALAVCLDRPIPSELADTLEALADYPVIDESDMSEYELETEDDAWNSWIMSDYIRALEAHTGLEDLDELDSEDLWTAYRQGCELSNTYPEAEIGGGVWIDVERVAQATPLELLTT